MSPQKKKKKGDPDRTENHFSRRVEGRMGRKVRYDVFSTSGGYDIRSLGKDDLVRPHVVNYQTKNIVLTRSTSRTSHIRVVDC